MQLGVLFGSQLLGGGFGLRLAFMGASIVGSMLLQGKKKPVGKLNDVRVSSSTYGRGIPKVWGTMRVTGNMFWATDFEEEKRYVGRKGKEKSEKAADKGKAQTVYEYYANYAMGLCEGPIDDVLRVWADNNLIFDKLNPDNEDLVQVGFSEGEDEGGKKNQANKKASGPSGSFAHILFNGSEVQQQNPFMVEKQGAEAVPGYRGLAYLFFQRFPLKDFGNRIPTITAEIVVRQNRKPVAVMFENMEPKTPETFQDKYPADGGEIAVFDHFNNQMYAEAELADGTDILRVYDTTDLLEVKRIHLEGPEWEERFPQTVYHFSHTTMNGGEVSYEGPTDIESDELTQYVGIAANGDLVFTGKLSNYSPVYFVNPSNMRVTKAFGKYAILGATKQATYVEYAVSAFPIFGTGVLGSPVPVTCIVGFLGNVWMFDVNHDLIAYIDTPFGSNARIIQGQPDTDQGAFAYTDGAYGKPARVYAFRTLGAVVDEDTGKVTINQPQCPLFCQFPNSVEETYNSDYIVRGCYTMFCSSTDTLCMIVGIDNHATIEDGLYCLKFDRYSGEEIWRHKMEDVSWLSSPAKGFINTPILSGHLFAWNSFNTSPGLGDYSSRYFVVDWKNENVKGYYSGNTVPAQTFGQYYMSDKHSIIYFSDAVEEGKWLYCSVDRKGQNGTSIAQICSDIALGVGIPEERIDTSEMIDDEITGYMIEQPTEARSVLDELANVFMFDAVESDNILKFRRRGTESVLDIYQEDLGIVDTEFGVDNEYYSETRLQETELPERVNISYLNSEEDYEQGTIGVKRPQRPLNVMGSRELLEITMNMASDPVEAKTIAQRVLYAAWAERTSHEYTLPLDYVFLDPSDVITIHLDNGVSFQDRITDIEMGADNSLKLTTVNHIAPVYTYTADIDPNENGGLIRIPRPAMPVTYPHVMDIPYLRDLDAEEGGEFAYYWSALPHNIGFSYGALIARKQGNSSRYEGATNFPAVWGNVDTIVPPPPHEGVMFDYETEIKLWPKYDFSEEPFDPHVWESVDDADWPNEDNMIIIGEEVILFKTVVENADGSVTISNLLRGYRGTDNAARAHSNPNERWVFFSNYAAIKLGRDEISYRNTLQTYYIDTTGAVPGHLFAENHTLSAASRKPLQVGDIRRTNTAGTPGSIQIDWRRSTRYGGALTAGTGSVPLNEGSERYEVFLLKAPYDENTWNPELEDMYWATSGEITSPTHTFDSATLTAAGLTYQSDIHVVIYQLSDLVGRGFPKGTTLPYSMFGI